MPVDHIQTGFKVFLSHLTSLGDDATRGHQLTNYQGSETSTKSNMVNGVHQPPQQTRFETTENAPGAYHGTRSKSS
jgi:hypothetical protein